MNDEQVNKLTTNNQTQEEYEDDEQPVDFSVKTCNQQDTNNQTTISGIKRKYNPQQQQQQSDCSCIVTTSSKHRQLTSGMEDNNATSHFHLHSSGFNGGYPGYHLSGLHHHGQRTTTTVATNNTQQVARDTQQHHHQQQQQQRTNRQLLRHHHHHDDHVAHQPPPPLPPQPQQPPTSIANEGDYRLTLREELKSSSGIYQVLEFLGRGTFGQVVKCWKLNTNELYAVKILKNQPSYIRQGQIEVQILNILGKENADDWNFVRAFETFTHHDHTCLVFELLGKNLYDYARSLPENRFKFKQIRPILQQVLRALSKLRQLGLIHADLKPENIMLVNPDNQPCRVKVIDFGSASKVNKDVHQTYLQSRYYRAPEIILGLGFDEKIDMWSLGCVAAELYLGQPLYPGSSEYDQIRFITETQGTPNLHMLRNGEKTHRFFTERALNGSAPYCAHYQPMTSQYRLKTHQEYEMETGTISKENRKFRLNNIEEVTRVHPVQPGPDQELEQTDSFEFLQMLRRMMVLDPCHRMKPNDALLSPFVTMSHLLNNPTQYYQDSVAAMEVCGPRSRQPQPQQQTVAAAANYLPTTAFPNPSHPPAFPTLHGAANEQQQPRGTIGGNVVGNYGAARNFHQTVATTTAAAAPLYFYGFQSSPHARNPVVGATAGGGSTAAAAAAIAAGAMFQQHLGSAGGNQTATQHHRFVHQHHQQQQVAAHVAAHVPLISQAGQLLAVPGWTPGFAAVAAAGFSTPFMGNVGNELLRRQHHNSLLSAAASGGGGTGDNIFTSYQPPHAQAANFQPTYHHPQLATRTAAANNNAVTTQQQRIRRGDVQQQQPIFISDSPGSVITISSESDNDESMHVHHHHTPTSTTARGTEQVVIPDEHVTTAGTNQPTANRQQRRVVAAVAPFQQQHLQQRNAVAVGASATSINSLASTNGSGGGNIIFPFTTMDTDDVLRQQVKRDPVDDHITSTVLATQPPTSCAWGVRDVTTSQQQQTTRIPSQNNRKRQRSQVLKQQPQQRPQLCNTETTSSVATRHQSITSSTTAVQQQQRAQYLQLATEAQQQAAAAAQAAIMLAVTSSHVAEQQAPTLYPASTHPAAAQQRHHAAAYRLLRGQAPYYQ